RAARCHGGVINQLSHEVRSLIVIRAALGLIFYAALTVWLFDVRAGAWSSLPVPEMTRWLAAVVLRPTLVFFTWSFRSLGTNYRGGVVLYDAHVLVTTGPYRLMRHP